MRRKSGCRDGADCPKCPSPRSSRKAASILLWNATVDDINPALPLVSLGTLNHGNYGMFLLMGSAGFI